MSWSYFVTYYWNLGLYTPEDMKKFVVSGWITPETYKELTGTDYVPDAQ